MENQSIIFLDDVTLELRGWEKTYLIWFLCGIQFYLSFPVFLVWLPNQEYQSSNLSILDKGFCLALLRPLWSLLFDWWTGFRLDILQVLNLTMGINV